MALALALRLIPLGLKAPWMDEVASSIFSLGNSSRNLPLNELADLESFLRPLTANSRLNPGGVIHYLLKEDNHPPFYFLLSHGWLHLLQPQGGLASIAISRLLPALLGTACVPLSIWTGRLAFGSQRAGLLAGFWMAVSPLAVAQSLEIRQYSLAILLASASMLCLVKSWKLFQARQPLPWWWLTTWLIVNSAGISTHYFFIFALLMQLASVALLMPRNSRALAALLGSIAFAACWLPLLSNYTGSTQTSWLKVDPSRLESILAIPLQALGGLLFNAIAPGTYAVHSWQWPFAIAAGLSTLCGLVFLVQLAFSAQTTQDKTTAGPALYLFKILTASGLGIQIGISLLMLSDYTKGLRYSFFLIPPATALLTGLCELYWLNRKGRHPSLAIGLLVCGLICAIGVDAGVVLPKWYSADLLIERISKQSEQPIVIAYDHNPVGIQANVIGIEPLSIAWWIAQHPDLQAALHKNSTPSRMIVAVDGPGLPLARRERAKQELQSIKSSFDLWVIGGNPESFITSRCDLRSRGSEGSHSFSHYRCKSPSTP